MDPSQLPSLAWFVHVAYHLSFTRAAAEMGVSRAALSQNLKALEQQLNVKLLYRTTRDMSLTEDGQRLYDTLRPAFGSIEQAISSLHEVRHAPSGLLRVNTSRVAARTLIEPHLGEFMARYPLLRVELVMNDGMSNIIADGCDAGIRLGESLAEHMVAVPITPMIEMVVAGSPDYLARHGKPATPADLIAHNCLCYRQTTSGAIYRWEFTSTDIEGHAFEVEPKGSVVTNDDDGMIRVALQGVGLIQHQDIALREHLAAGTLVRVLDAWCKPFPGYYLYTPSREQMPAKVRALMDFLVEKRERLAVDLGKRAPRPAAPKRRKAPTRRA
ncbi:MAG: HTH-type transcriptional regulator PgrR [Burkholderia lata]|uniref:HTH-type transcriptional regulator PgrR n=1 Tax=Burkholderia lata (strain ATCC 17760 / DSM 23089 / LMG 22485 / NCIMB 9086 / R18194 / 383) TaxID=482957 RepID=A0A833PKB6_BURL3|nr:LysR family transcriptional regulator [Burkholderia lata]KAF1031879.1 MAG: HTH-type transcriptional regulator PgrR [Burkholderia lata]